MRLRRVRGRESIFNETGGCTRELLGLNDAGNPIARVIRLDGPTEMERRTFHAIALDRDARLIRLLPLPPADGDWFAVIGNRVVSRARRGSQPCAAPRHHSELFAWDRPRISLEHAP